MDANAVITNRPEYLQTNSAFEEHMEDDIVDGLGNNGDSKHLPDDHETILLACPEGFPSAVELALTQYADSIESLSTGSGNRIDHYTRGFIAGIRAASKVVANVIRT